MSGIPHKHYEPKSKFMKWMESRLKVGSLVYDTLMIPTPKTLNWWWIWGIVLTFTLVMMIVTGIVLAMHYQVSDGFGSVEKIMRDVPFGWAIRYIHFNGATLFFAAVYVHIFRGLYYGSYKAPREITWLVGIIIYFLMMGTAFLGYTLPQGQMSLHGGSVITGLAGAIPFIGDTLKSWLLGGPAMSEATYNRFFALHFLLPFVIAALVAVHIWAFHSTGNNNPDGIEVRRDSLDNVEKDTVPFWPYFVVKDLVGLGFVLMAFTVVVWAYPNYFGHPDNYIAGNRFVTPEHIVPEWYFLPFYAMLRAIDFDILFIDAKFGGLIVMVGSIFIMALAPWTDTSRVRSGRYRPRFKWFFWLLIVDFFVLMWAGSMSPSPAINTISLIGIVYWFGYFLVILPALGIWEKPLEQPATIEEAFANKYHDEKE